MIDDYHKILEKKLKSIAKEIEKFLKILLDTRFMLTPDRF